MAIKKVIQNYEFVLVPSWAYVQNEYGCHCVRTEWIRGLRMDPRPDSPDGVPTKRKNAKVKDVLLKIAELIEKNPRIENSELAVITGVSQSSIDHSQSVRDIRDRVNGSAEREAKKKYTGITPEEES